MMKNIKNLLVISLIMLCIACDQDNENINTIYDNVNGQSLIAFQGTSSDLAVTIDETGTVDVVIQSSTIASFERTVSVSIDEESTANSENYTLSTTNVVIPANAYFGILQINGVDNSVETTPETIILNIDGFSENNSVINQSSHTVNIYQVCPVPNTYFTGMYLMEQVSAYVDGPTLDDGAVVNVTANGNARIFSTSTYPDYCPGSPINFRMNLVCNEIVVPRQNTICRCVSVVDWFGPATTNQTYDLEDDTEILVTFSDDVQVDCGPTAQTTYRFTKQ